MHPYRYWFDRNLSKWCIAPADDKSGTKCLVVDELKTCELDSLHHPDGTITCRAELLADGSTMRFDTNGTMGSCRHATLRLLRIYDTQVVVPVMAMKTAMRKPGC